MARTHWRRILICLVMATALAEARALSDEEVFREFRFNLINPGARSLALGGAFISLADDATAAQANPSGLAFLQAQEYFAELRAIDSGAQSSISTDTLASGFNTFAASGTDIQDVIGPTFLSVVTPLGRWSLGLSLQEVLNINNSTLSTFALSFPDSPGIFLAAGVGSVDVRVRKFNVSVGVRATDRLGLGATLGYARLDARSEVLNSFVDTAGIGDMPVLEQQPDLRTTVDDDDDDVVFSLGLVYKVPQRWSVGAVYHRAPKFKVRQTVESLQDTDGDGVADDDLFDVGKRFPTGSFVNEMNLPDSYGIGGNFLPIRDRLTLTAQIERILYSNLLDNYVAGLNVLTGPNAEFDLDDATELRLGAEYIFFWGSKPLALRGGTFTQSETRVSASSTDSDFSTESAFKEADRLIHGTIGLGIGLNQHQIDLAADFSEADNQYVISYIYRGKPH